MTSKAGDGSYLQPGAVRDVDAAQLLECGQVAEACARHASQGSASPQAQVAEVVEGR